jgi:AcrR family transcriptional regulator
MVEIRPMVIAPLHAPSRDALLALATDRFTRGERLDIQSLATELGVSRATAYRWAGNHDDLLANVIAGVAEANFHHSVARAKGAGADRIIDAMRRGMRSIVGSAGYRRVLEADPQKTLRLAASKEGPSQGRMVALHQSLLEEEVAAGNLSLAVDAHTMAYALVRTAESFLYADLIAGEKPDIDKAVEVLRLLLR